VVDQNRERVEELRKRGMAAVSGDAAEPATLIQAHIARAALLVIATPDALGVRQMIETARTLNPGVGVVVRSHSEDEAGLLEREGAARVFIGEQELAQAMVSHVLGAVAR
jgi:CPA2 family monovalent cation:H+ antiporter-2